LLKLKNRFPHGPTFASSCYTVFDEVANNNFDNPVQRGSYRGNLVDNLGIASIILHHPSNRSNMAFNSREVRVNLGPLMSRHTLPMGGDILIPPIALVLAGCWLTVEDYSQKIRDLAQV
jgi:hypothetical protein